VDEATLQYIERSYNDDATKCYQYTYILYLERSKSYFNPRFYVDDTLCAGEKKEVEWAYKKIEEKIKIVRLGRLMKQENDKTRS
jgi:hypothetical protein